MLLAAAVNDRVIANVEGSAWSVYARGYLVFAVVFWLAIVSVLPQRVVGLLAVAGVWSLGCSRYTSTYSTCCSSASSWQDST